MIAIGGKTRGARTRSNHRLHSTPGVEVGRRTGAPVADETREQLARFSAKSHR